MNNIRLDMQVTVKYFGAIAEQTGTREEILNLEETGNQIDQLKAYCMDKYKLVDEGSIQLAVNQELNAKKTLQAGDEVAFLPPYAGG